MNKIEKCYNEKYSKIFNKILKKITLKGDFILRSGLKTNTYYDKYLIFSDPLLLYDVVSLIMEKFIYNPPSIDELYDCVISYDYYAGLSTGGIPLAAIMSQIDKKGLCIIRKEKKLYGTKKIVEGSVKKGSTLLVIEDIITTGGQVIKSIIDIRNEGYFVNDVICIIDRGKDSQKKIFKKTGVNLHSLFEINKDCGE